MVTHCKWEAQHFAQHRWLKLVVSLAPARPLLRPRSVCPGLVKSAHRPIGALIPKGLCEQPRDIMVDAHHGPGSLMTPPPAFVTSLSLGQCARHVRSPALV